MRTLKQSLLSLFIRFLQHPSVQQELNRQIALSHGRLLPLANTPSPYGDLEPGNEVHGRILQADALARGPAERMAATETPVFVTSRFRSGSTLLWNLFRQLEGCTAYYEPFNERQWFNASLRGEQVDKTHRGVSDYWREYADMENLGQWYREDWISEALYMDAQSWDPAMLEYVRGLIHHAQGRAVLQFNRVDFRLGWLRHHFPEAPIVHLYRHPREQWLSFLTDKQAMTAQTIENTYVDGFYLDTWCADLQRHYPFLNPVHTPHPYRRFYYLWKLSYLHGRHYASVSHGFEELVNRPQESLRHILDTIKWHSSTDTRKLATLVDAPPMDRWRDYASEDWFCGHEAHCEQVLDDFLRALQYRPHPATPSPCTNPSTAATEERTA